MKSLLFSFTFSLFVTVSFAQQNVISSGNNSSSSSGKISYSVGLINYKNAEGTGGSSSVGSQIPFEITETLSTASVDFTSFDIYPNPTVSDVILKLKAPRKLDYKVHDISGRQIKSGTINGLETKVELHNLKTSIYILSIYVQNSIVKSYRIIKK